MTTYLITGANRGIGLELAKQLTARGDKVICTVRDLSTIEDLKALGVRVESLEVSEPASIKMLGERLADQPIDVLINNAGISSEWGKSLEDLEPIDMIRVYTTNAIGPIMVSRALLPSLRKGDRKLIVQISSVMGSLERAFNDNAKGNYAYRGSKAALNMHTISLANDLKDEGIAAVGVHPGWVRTRMGGEKASLSPSESAAMLVKTIDGLSMKQTGKFFDTDGSPLPW